MAIIAMMPSTLKTVTVAELKDRLSHYLKAAQAGQEIVVRSRNTPIARIVPLAAEGDMEGEEAALVAAGKLRPGAGPLPASFWSTPAPRVSLDRIAEALDAERRED